MAATLHGPGRAVEAGSLSAVATDGGDSPEAPLRRRPQLAVLVEGADRRGLLHDMTAAIQRYDGDIVSVEIVERGARSAVYWAPAPRSARSRSAPSAKPTATTSVARRSASTPSRSSARRTWPTPCAPWAGCPGRWPWCWQGR